MKKSNQHKNNLTKLHKEKLGMDIPENFFSNSKEEILNKISLNETSNKKVFWLKPLIAYPIAASLIIAFAITFWLKNNETAIDYNQSDTIDVLQVNSSLPENDFLVSSLLIPNEELEQFLDQYITHNIIIEAELSEQQLENLFINSLFIEDSLINEYLDKSLIENLFI